MAFFDTADEVLRILIAEPASGLVFLGVFVILYLFFSNRTVRFFLSLCTRVRLGSWRRTAGSGPLVILANKLISESDYRLSVFLVLSQSNSRSDGALFRSPM